MLDADGFREYARLALGTIRLVNGAAALVAPETFARRLGVDPESNPAGSYVLRLFGIRTLLIGYELLSGDEATRTRALRVAPLVHANDALAAVLAGGSGRLPRRAAVAAAVISSTNVALAVAARRGTAR